MAVQIQVRRGTAAEWTSANPTLLAGEMGAETDTGRFKIGDGSTAWTSLGYATAPAAYNSVNTQSGTTYTFASGDDLKLTKFTSSSAVTATIPPNSSVAYVVGSRLDVLQDGSGQVTLSPGSGVTLNSSTTLSARSQYSIISAIKVDSDTWVVSGDLEVL